MNLIHFRLKNYLVYRESCTVCGGFDVWCPTTTHPTTTHNHSPSPTNNSFWAGSCVVSVTAQTGTISQIHFPPALRLVITPLVTKSDDTSIIIRFWTPTSSRALSMMYVPSFGPS